MAQTSDSDQCWLDDITFNKFQSKIDGNRYRSCHGLSDGSLFNCECDILCS